MKYWRMAFRNVSTGYPMWHPCFQHGVAACAYEALDDIDLSKHPYGAPPEKWAQHYPIQRASLRRVAYEMAAGDIIYVKEGPSVVGRGEVQGPYAYALCEEIKDDEGHLWPHQVPVKWDPEFTPIRILVGAEQHSTVCELREEDLRRLGEAESLMQENLRSAEDEEAREEGELVHAYISFRRRNRTLVEAKRAQCASKPCEACGFSFTSRYGGSIGELQEVHHRNPIAEREGVTVTTLEDLVWICPNCHRALHSTRPAMSVDALRQRMRQPEQRNGQRTRTAARVVVVRRPRATIGAQG